MAEKRWQLYMLRCCDGTLYTGISVDAQKRFRKHCEGKGAKYTKGRMPLEMVFCLDGLSHSEALRMEYAVKKLNRKQKEELLRSDPEELLQAVNKRPNQA